MDVTSCLARVLYGVWPKFDLSTLEVICGKGVICATGDMSEQMPCNRLSQIVRGAQHAFYMGSSRRTQIHAYTPKQGG